jgi:predicted DNA-binding transcriptional regulator YafY
VRADRLLSIVLLLDTHRHLTAGDMARRLEVSERTIYRDIDALSAAGVPVYAQRGGRGGCYLPDGYRTRLTGLTAAEAQVLSLRGPAKILADLGLGEAVDAAQMKLLRALPDGVRSGATAAHERVLVEAAGWDPPLESVPHLEALQSAVWSERQLEMVYCRSDGTTVERRVDPLGLVAKGSVWYLVSMMCSSMGAPPLPSSAALLMRFIPSEPAELTLGPRT